MQKNYAETGSLIRTQTSPVKSILRNSMSVTQSLSKHEQRPSPNYEQAERENSTESSPESKQLTASFSGTTPMFGLPVGPGGDDPRAKLRAPSPSKSIGITRTSRDLPSALIFHLKIYRTFRSVFRGIQENSSCNKHILSIDNIEITDKHFCSYTTNYL